MENALSQINIIANKLQSRDSWLRQKPFIASLMNGGVGVIHFNCPHCGKALAPGDDPGARVICPACSCVVEIPLEQKPPVPVQSAGANGSPIPKGTIKRLKKANKTGFLVTFLIPALGGLILLVIGIILEIDAGAKAARAYDVVNSITGHKSPAELEASEALDAARSLIGLGLLAIICSHISLLVFIYRMWAAIQSGPASTTPGNAVGLLFVPIYGAIWQFTAIGSWATEYNAFVSRRGIRAPMVPRWIGTTICILNIAGALPCIDVLAFSANVMLWALLIALACDGINSIAADPEKACLTCAALPSTAEAVKSARQARAREALSRMQQKGQGAA